MSTPALELAVFMFDDGGDGKQCSRLRTVKKYLRALPDGESGCGYLYTLKEQREVSFTAILKDGKVNIREGGCDSLQFFLEERHHKLYLTEQE